MSVPTISELARLHESSLGADITASRPISFSERFWVGARGPAGTGDILPLIGIDCPPSTPVTDDDVVHAWTVLRLRHSALASHIENSDDSDGLRIVATSAPTKARLIEQARARIEFGVFEDRKREIDVLCTQWEGVRPARAVDVSQEIAVVWMKDASGKAPGQYLFGIQSAHMLLDSHRWLDVLRQFVELLSAPWQAEAELDTHFAAGPPGPPRLKPVFEDMYPGLDIFSADAVEQQKGKDAYAEMSKNFLEPSGLTCDGPIDFNNVDSRSLRHVFPEETTSEILRRCKARGVTVAQLFQSIWTAAVIEVTIELHGPDSPGNGLPVYDDEYRLALVNMMDLSRFTKGRAPRADEVSLQAIAYPSFIAVPRALIAAHDRAALVWSVAARAKASWAALTQSPHFWHLLAHFGPVVVHGFGIDTTTPAAMPFVPYMSSMGLVSDYLPSRVVAPAAPDARAPKALRIAEYTVFMRAACMAGLSHFWTFNGRLALQWVYNATSVSPELAGKYYGRMVEILTELGSPA